MEQQVDEGRTYTRGSSFRARAEARQRWYRAHVLKQSCGAWGHWLALTEPPEKTRGNFVCDAAFESIRQRAARSKGVDVKRTFGNMLSSQAMCFNLFGPLMGKANRNMAAHVIRRLIPSLASVERIDLEYTPDQEIFGDQTGLSGVDCDVLIEFTDASAQAGVLVIETKFVETEFSMCGFRKSTNKTPCPQNVVLGEQFEECNYTRKGYRYWDRAAQLGTLAMDKVRAGACPFGGELWQLWVNHTLAHTLRESRHQAARAIYAVCAPKANDALQGEAVVGEFRRWVADPSTVVFIGLEDLIEALGSESQESTTKFWIKGLRDRYLVDIEPSVSPCQ